MLPLHQFVPHKTLGGLQAGQGAGSLRFIASQAHKDSDGAHSCAQAYFCHHHRRGQPWIFQFPCEHQTHFVSDLFGDAFGPMTCVVSLSLHDSSPSSKYSICCESRWRPKTRSDSAPISASDFSRCPESPEMETTPTRERCQVS